jgi:hypothetical protein
MIIIRETRNGNRPLNKRRWINDASEPFPGDILIENQYGQRQQQANSAEQRHRDQRFNAGDRCHGGAGE